MKPWERYKAAPAAEAGPWEGYEAPTPPRQTVRGTRQTAPYVERVSEVAGYPISAESDLPWGERAMLGLSDTLAEKQAEFARMYPAGGLQEVELPTGKRELVYSRGPLDKPRLLDEPGVTLGDIADRPQSLVEIPLQLGAAVLGPASIPAQLGIQSAVPGLTHLAKEGIQEMRGMQQEPLSSVLKTAGMESALDLALGGAGEGLAAVGRGIMRGPAGKAGTQIVDDYSAIQALKELEDVPDPFMYQLRPDMAIIEGLSKQARSTSAAMQGAERAQQSSFADLLETLQNVPISRTGQVLVKQGKTALRKAEAGIRRSFFVDSETAGKAVKGIFTDTFNKKSRAQINQAYDEAGALAEGVSFDLTRAKRTAQEVTAPVEATATQLVDSEIVDLMGAPLTQNSVKEFVNVATTPSGKVARVSSLLNKIDDVQTNWEVIKELRSQVGEVIKDLPNEDATSGAAKALWGSLTDVIENPVGGGKAFVKQWRKANDLSRARFNVYEQGKVLQILGEDSPARIGNMIGNDPTVLTPTIRNVIKEYAPDQIETIRRGVQTSMLTNPGGAMDAYAKWTAGGAKNEQAFNFIFPNRKVKGEFIQAAEQIDMLRNSPIQQMIDSSDAMINRGKTLLSRTGPAEMEAVIRTYGGKQSAGGQAVRLAAFDDIISKAITSNKDGIVTLNSNALDTAVREAKRRGIWEKVLTKEDRIRVNGLGAYVRRVLKSSSDVGVSLEKQQAIASLKHPTTMIQGIHALAVNNRVLAPLMMSKTAAKLFRPRKARGQGARGLKPGSWAFIGNVVGEVNRVTSEEATRQ